MNDQCIWEDPPCTKEAAPGLFWCHAHAALDPPSPPRQCGGMDGGLRCPNLIHRYLHLCWVHDPDGWPEVIRADAPANPLGAAGPEWVDDSPDPPTTHGSEPTPAWAQPTDPWAQPTKYDEIDPAQRISVAACELPEPCALCDAAPNQCHAFIFGALCRFPARRSRPYCINHDPGYRTQHREQSQRGGAATTAATLRRKGPALEDVSLFLGSRAGVQATIDLIVRLELLGRIAPQRSRNILRALYIAVRNFDRGSDRLDDQAMGDYLNYREDVELFMADILRHAQANDAPAPRPPSPPKPAQPSKKATFAELMGGPNRDPDQLGKTLFSFDEDIQTPDDLRRLVARMRPR